MKRILDFDPLTGMTTYFVDNHDGYIQIVGEQNVDGIIENNKRLAGERDAKKQIDKGWWHYATIPNILVEKWSKEVGGDILAKQFEKELLKRVNHPDYAYLKTTQGRHAKKA